MRCLVTAGKHVKNIRAIPRQPPITKIKGLLEAVFSVESTPSLCSEDRRPAESSSVHLSEVKWSEVKWSEVKWSEVKWSEVKWSEVKWSEVVGWLTRWQRHDHGSWRIFIVKSHYQEMSSENIAEKETQRSQLKKEDALTSTYMRIRGI
jgi:hypothetical protein